MRLGYFAMPLHPPGADPAQTMDEDLEQLATLDRLGFAEAWIGEHFTAEWENIPCPDLFIAQNFFSPQRETGRMDGGLGALMLGDGAGGFTPVRADQSGIVLPRDMSDVIAADLNDDGRTDLIVAANDGPVAVFEARPPAENSLRKN